jgi:hypothetical protein
MKTLADDMINQLDDLRLYLMELEDRLKKSGIERTKGLRDAMGDDCRFYKRSMQLFLEKDYEDIKTKIENAHKLFLLIEGKNG